MLTKSEPPIPTIQQHLLYVHQHAQVRKMLKEGRACSCIRSDPWRDLFKIQTKGPMPLPEYVFEGRFVLKVRCAEVFRQTCASSQHFWVF